MTSWYEKSRLTETIALSCRVLGKLDMTYAALGHVSHRLSEGSMLIKGKGADESALRSSKPRDILEVDFDADPMEAPEGLRPPSESFIHTEIYKARPDAQCVIHCHAKYPVLMSLCDKELLPLGNVRPGVDLAIQGIPTYPRTHLITTSELGIALVKSMAASKVVIMRGHGISVYGSSIEDATLRAISLNELAALNYEAYLLGDVRPVSVEDVMEITQQVSMPRSRGEAGGEAGIKASWRYWCEYVGESSDI
jgi:L-fuculose-phosphate aldolase